MTTGDLQQHLAEIYDTEISRETISKITDAILEDMQAWQHRPLDPVYAVLLIDCIVVKIRVRRSPTGPFTWSSRSTWTASVTCSACGSARRAVRARSSGRRCSPSSATGAEVCLVGAMRKARLDDLTVPRLGD